MLITSARKLSVLENFRARHVAPGFVVSANPELSTKIAQTECNNKRKAKRIFFGIAEVPSIFCKDSTRTAVKIGENTHFGTKRSF